jgi:sarcosine oxidase subunit beta
MNPPFPASRLPDAIVVGGGLHGCSTAFHLASRHGLKALVLEQTYPGRHASGVNAGGVRTLGRVLPEIPLSLASMEIWHHLPELVGDDCGFVHSAQVKVAESEADMDILRARNRELRGLGYTHEALVDAHDLRRLLPAVSPHCIGGLVAENDGCAIPFRAVTGFRRAAERLGAEVRSGWRADRIERVGDLWRISGPAGTAEAPLLAVCAGAWGDKLSAQVGEPVPLNPEAPMLLITERVSPFLVPVVGCASRRLSFKQYPNGTVLIGGGYRGIADRDAERTTLKFSALAANVRVVCELFPLMKTVRIVRAWSGIEGLMPDAIPVLGPSLKAPGLVYGFGYSSHGFQMGPIGGRIVADLLATGKTDLPIAPFSVGRFAA